MGKKIATFLVLIGIALMFFQIFETYHGNTSLNKTAAYYAANGPDELGSANLVTSVVVTYRGLDTLGEVTILFLVASIIGFFLKVEKEAKTKREVRDGGEILQTASSVLVPIIFLFGAYVFVNGHLSPGGGFQGGAIIASGTLLIFLADPFKKLGHNIITIIESIAGFSYVVIGILGIFLAGGFLDNRILPLGEFGKLFSAGAIPVIYSLVGLKVGSELSAVLGKFNAVQEEN
jgi:multicomponent Na+:H+ antiporter subunit B